MLRTKWFIHLSLAAAFAIAIPLLADDSGKGGGPTKPEDTPKVDDRGGSTTPAPSAPAPSTPAQPDDKGVDPASKPDDKGVDPATKPDDKGVDPATKPDDKGVDPASKQDDKGVDPASKQDDKGTDGNFDSRKEDFSATPDGSSLRCSGRVEIRVEREVEHPRERFKVEVEAQVNDGMVFIVSVNGKPAAAMMVRDGKGELQLENEPGRVQPAGVFPVREIKNVTVTSNTGVMVLRKDF